MRKQQNLYSEMKTELQRRNEFEADLKMEMAAPEALTAMTDISEEVGGGGGGTDTDVEEARKSRGVSASPGLATRNRCECAVNLRTLMNG